MLFMLLFRIQFCALCIDSFDYIYSNPSSCIGIPQSLSDLFLEIICEVNDLINTNDPIINLFSLSIIRHIKSLRLENR